jgi:hypothetical protein
MYSLYKSIHPEFLNSRQDFALFVFRAHNTVNIRLDKPTPKTVSECLLTLKLATTQTSLAEFRQSYLSYLMRIWGRNVSGEGMITRNYVVEMNKINNEYWSPRELAIPDLIEGDVITPIQSSVLRVSRGVAVSTAVGFKGGKLTLARR